MTQTSGSPSKLQGYMSLKSNAFNPVSGKLSSQHMVLNHMNAHYKKLVHAKSAIDSKPPKAYTSSQKVRDRLKRESMLVGGVLPNKSPSPGFTKSRTGLAGSRSVSMQNLSHQPQAYGHHHDASMMAAGDLTYDVRGDDPQDEYEMNYLNSAYTNQMYVGHQKQPPRGTGGDNLEGGRGTSRSTESRRHQPESKDTGVRKKQSGDILDKRGHKFTEPEALFTPRILKKDVPSHLSQNSKTYCPGRPKSRANSAPKMRRSTSQQSIRASSETTSAAMLDETIVSRDFSVRLQQSGAVPPLDISLDADHMKWLKEQAASTEKRRSRSAAGPPNPGQSLSSTGASATFNRVHRGKTSAGTTGGHISGSSPNMSWTMKKVKDEEEDLKYLNFVKNVTTDVLTRGIFTNRVLRQVFEQHVARHRGELDETRMKQLIDTLRDDLGIPKDDDVTSPDDVGMGDSRPPMSSTFGRQVAEGDLLDLGSTGGDHSIPGHAWRDNSNNGFSSDSSLLKTSKQPFELGLRSQLEDVLEESEKTHSSKSRESTRRFPDEDDYGAGNETGGDNRSLTEISYLDNISSASKDTLSKLKDEDSFSNASTSSTVKGSYAAALARADRDADQYSAGGSSKGSRGRKSASKGQGLRGDTHMTDSPTPVPRPKPRSRHGSAGSSRSTVVSKSTEPSKGGEYEDALYSDNFSDEEDGF